MAKKFLVALDLAKNELQNAKVQNLGSAPSVTPVADKGLLYFNSTDNTLYWYDGAQFIAAKAAAGATPAGTVTTQAVGDAGVVGVSTNFAREDHRHGMPAFGTPGASNPGNAAAPGSAVTIARSDHAHSMQPWSATVTSQTTFGLTGNQGAANEYARGDHTHGTPSLGNVTAQTTFGQASNNGAGTTAARNDHLHGTPVHDAAAHSAIPRSALAAPTADMSMGGFKLTSVGAPTTGSDATNKTYVDNLSAGLAWKDAVRCATTANIANFTTNGPFDGVTLGEGERVLVKNQTTTNQNGIYEFQTSSLVRSADADSSADLVNATVFVSEGTTQADTAWVMTANAPITVNTTPLPWVQFGAGTVITAGAGLTGTNTFDVVAGDTSLTVAADDVRVNTAVIATVASVPPNARTITAGAGLTGGGDLSANRTLDVVGDASITVAADNISRAALTGDVTASAGANATTIAANAVTNAKLAQMPTSTFKGRVALGTGDAEDLNVGQMKAVLGIPGTVPGKYSTGTVGGSTSQIITHNLNNREVMVNVYRTTTPWDTIECDVERTSTTTVTLRFATAPSANEYSCVVIG